MRAVEPDEDETLVVDLKGVTAEDQSEERVTEQTAGSTASESAAAQDTRVAQAGERQTDEMPTDAGPAIAATPQKTTAAKSVTGSPGSVNIRGAEQQQEAHRLRPRVENPVDPLRAYVKTLTKRLEAKLVYPEAGRQAGLHGWPTVAFTILADGGLDPNSLKLVSSSGSPKLDQSALDTVRASAPFERPPHEITLKLTLIYGR
jgi:periplasmic protein TonB